jgi:hypothetical protein
MAYKLRRSSHGGDRSRNRSLAETLAYGNERYGDEGWTEPSSNLIPGVDELYDESAGPRDMTRRPSTEEWGERAEGLRIFENDKSMADVMYTDKGKGKVDRTLWDEPEEVDEKLERKKWEKETGMSY